MKTELLFHILNILSLQKPKLKIIMGLIIWALIGLAAGAIAKAITPQEEKGGWVSSLIVGLIGSMVGGFLAGMIGLNRVLNSTWLGSLIVATGGAVLVLYIYHRYLKEKLNLPL